MVLRANKILVGPDDVPGTELKSFNSLKSELARRLGAKIKKHCDWSRPVALNFDQLKKIANAAKDKQGLKYQVSVCSKRRKLEFVLLEGTKTVKKIPILDLKEITEGAEVINLQGGDKTMGDSVKDDGSVKLGAASKQAKRFEKDAGKRSVYNDPRVQTDPRKGKTKVEEEPTDLAPLNKQKRIVLVGHGGGPKPPSGKRFTASAFGGRSAEQIVNFLIGEGLKPSYRGTIHLSGCYTAAGFQDDEAFAKQVQTVFGRRKYTKLKVAGTAGRSYTSDEGEKISVPAALDKDLDKSVERCQKLVAEMEKAKDEIDGEVSVLSAKLEQLKEVHAACAETLVAVPPKKREEARKRMLEPLEESQQEVQTALDQMLVQQTALGGGLVKERAYVAELENLQQARRVWERGLARAKASREAGEISLAQLKRLAAQLKATYRAPESQFRVDEWWGHFGTAKATRVKGLKKHSALKTKFAQLRAKLKGTAK